MVCDVCDDLMEGDKASISDYLISSAYIIVPT